MDNARTVSLVLGSGGARGMAHIGIIEWLNENGFAIRSISGSSMGALIGGIYAAGKLDSYTKWVRSLERIDVLSLLDLSFGLTGLFKGERIINVLKKLIGDRNIEDLPIAFTAVATDLDAEKEVWLNHGPLFDAIRASIAMPTIFTPHYYNGKTLVDGGLVNPIPIAPTLHDMTDITIAVNLSAKPEPQLIPSPKKDKNDTKNRYQMVISEFIEGMQQKLNHRETTRDMGFFDIISRSMDTMENTVARLKLAAYSPDVIIDIPRNSCAFYEFDRADEMIEIGRHKASQFLAHLKTG